LVNQDLEYSGFFADGWISDEAYVWLTPPQMDQTYQLAIKASVPLITDQTFTTKVSVFLGETIVYLGNLGVGEVNINIPVEQSFASKKQKVKLKFSKLQRLPNGDDRPVSIFIKSIQFTKSEQRDSSPITDQVVDAIVPISGIARFPDDLANQGLEYSGIFEDGWLSDEAHIWLAPPSKDQKYQLVIKGMIPFVDDQTFTTGVLVSLGETIVYRGSLGLGEVNINIPVEQGLASNKQKVKLKFSRMQRLPNGDNRQVSMLVKSIQFMKVAQ
jgi:hypothetical protein